MTAFTLKIIALTSMITDHMGAAFQDYFPFWFRAVGRLAWPIFAYLAAEGFRHTKAPEKYLMRLLVFALISEIPYDSAFLRQIDFLSNTNIFYTIFLGGMSICIYERLSNKYGWQAMAFIGAILPTAMLAEILSVDYGSMGVLLIFAMYVIKQKAVRLAALGGFALSQFIPLVAAYFLGVEINREYLLMIPFALAALPLIALYNGKRGAGELWAKWLFYCAYPVHLAVLAIAVIFY